ncbi:glycosyltransferase family 2 protein [Elizabethkingia anophelis]|uniref:Glycosyltransferase family 2 protein n=1 Tax=Elizabethkingia anophelis R26 TaxID=1246994 RepID=A0ABN5BWY5_9FLAO|nr:glycosyltransferase family 2 protein [Elizabethkingia anophelis]ATC36147.1 glycosyltransferase family 2 protein [Elizabethkingia anophelis R26]ATC39824.1 glycosyltransferase family 2 protein [Elizabethkingia anophelis Ag1]ATC43503.1 glycosyltransferase family 2 protein [Elizabethkingia anophelis]ATC47179.1 glycosyltransferase family 2 protein [Elizabethkingia anophelis]ELR81032.1 glycosyltransferase YibD [Elizabethkingia anophelis R26]
MQSLLPLVSIIMPVYNAEDTLYIAMDSILSQTYQNIELIIVNDCSKDDTLNRLYYYKDKIIDNNIDIKLISHETNKGVASARNTGLENASGQYVYYVDADDWIDDETIEILIKEQQKNDSDIVGCNWYLSFNQNERRMNQPVFTSSLEAIKKMTNGTMRWNLWLFMVRRSLYEEYSIRFLDGMNMGEDMMVMLKLFTHAEKVSYLDQALYHYGQSNEDSLTKTYSDQHRKEVTTNLYAVEKYLQESIYSKEIGDRISFLKLNIKLPLLISNKESDYKKWEEWFPEANSFVMKNTELPFRTRLLQWIAVKRQYWFLKLYYNIVIRYIYGIIYK